MVKEGGFTNSTAPLWHPLAMGYVTINIYIYIYIYIINNNKIVIQ